jgi:hypothetical protein
MRTSGGGEECDRLSGVIIAEEAARNIIDRYIGEGTIRMTHNSTDQYNWSRSIEHKSLHISQRTVVKAACKLAYCKNWSPLQAPAASLSPRSGDNFKQQWWTITSTDATVQAAYKLDTQPVLEETCLIVDTEAQTEADRRRDLWKVPRHIYTATYFANMMLTELGDVIQITHSRFGLAGGKTGIVVEISRDWLNGRITLGVFA